MERKSLKIAMVRKGVTGKALAEKTGINRSRISWIINGHWNPKEEEMAKISKVLGCTSNELFRKEILK